MRGDAVVSEALAEQRRLAAETHPDPARIADLEDLIAAHDGYTLEARASAVLEGLGIPTGAHRSAAVHAVGRVQAARAAGPGAGGRGRPAAAGRADQPPRHPVDPLAGEVPGRLRRLRGGHLARPALPGQRHHPHPGRRLPDHHALHRQLQRVRRRQAGHPRAQAGHQRAGPGRDRPQARLRRALRGQEHQGHPGPEPPQADRAHRGGGADPQQPAHAGAALRARPPQRQGGAGDRRASARPTAPSRC